MNDLNRVGMIGRLTKDPEMKVAGNATVTSFSIANNRSYKVDGEKREATSFFNCIAWGKLGEVINNYAKKGAQIAIEGRLQQRAWEDKDGNKRSTVEIVVENFQLIGGKAQEKQPDSVIDGQQVELEDNPFSDNDIPF